MTVAELIEHLRTMPPDLLVYVIDSDRGWLPLRASDVRGMHLSKMSRCFWRDTDFYIAIENDFDPPNGVGISV